MGASWEGFIIEQVLGAFQGQHVEPYFLRTSDHYEIDLVLNFGDQLWAIEIKLTSEPNLQDMNRLNKTADLIKADKRILISRVSIPVTAGNHILCSLSYFLNFINTKIVSA